MSNPDQDDEYYDAISEKENAGEDGSPSTGQTPQESNADLDSEQTAPSDMVYFELEDMASSDSDAGDMSTVTSESETTYPKMEDKWKTAKLEVKKFELEKSDVSVADKAKVFESVNKVDDDQIQSMSTVHHKEKTEQDSGLYSMPKKLSSHNSIQDNGSMTASAGIYSKVIESGERVGEYERIPVYEMAKPIPLASASKLDPPLKTTTSQPSAVTSAPVVGSTIREELMSVLKTGPSSCDESSSDKKLHYMSVKVPTVSVSSEPGAPQSFVPSTSGNRGCHEGTGQAVPVDFITPAQKPEADDQTSEYNRLYYSTMTSELPSTQREMLCKRGYSSLVRRGSVKSKKSISQSGNQEADSDQLMSDDEDDLSFDWGSEFDDASYQGSVDNLAEDFENDLQAQEAPDKPLPPKPAKVKLLPKSLLDPVSPVADPLIMGDLQSMTCLPVIINPEKHPPPVLPASPVDLTTDQKKRRCIVDLIIRSERSYLKSLERIIQQYQRTVLEYLPQPKSHVRPVFAEMHEIIAHHQMFQIELAESARLWDQNEKIGDIFTASFSKTMLVNAYSIYVNNFAAAMDEIRTLQRSRQCFDEFLKKQEKLNPDRLSIFGLMVKPVQRFPQFIMLLQDLIKYTPQTHHDRRALQLALTELENVTHKLNERKRHSEQRFQAQHALQQLMRQKVQHLVTTWNIDGDRTRRLLRTDTVEQVFGEFGNMKCKDRRLILMNDIILCVKVIHKEQSGYPVERLALRWMAKLRDLELKDPVLTTDMHDTVLKDTGRLNIIAGQLNKPDEDPFHLFADLREMLHDYGVLGQIANLMATLKRSYAGHGFREELVHEVASDLQRMIHIKDEQLRLVNSCSIILVDTSRSERPHYVMQTATAAIKHEWCIDFLMAKLALEKPNMPAWDGPTSSDDMGFDQMPTHFMKCLQVDVPRNYTKIRCAVSIFLNTEKSQSGIGVQHLWVCSSTPLRGQVSIISIHSSRPALIESFRACPCEITAVELVPGCGGLTLPKDSVFAEDTIWLTTARKEILIFPLTWVDSVHRDPLAMVQLPAVSMSLKFVDERLFCGLDDGTISVFSRNEVGSWNVSTPSTLSFGTELVKLHFVLEEDLWLSCGTTLFVLEIDSLVTKGVHSLADHCDSPVDFVVKSGVGVWVSFQNSSVIKLFHIESMGIVQEMSIGNFINRVRTEKLWTLVGDSDAVVTCLGASKGLLWIGTSIGVVLTLPLPRLSDGVPLYRGSPSVSLHCHRGPVRFFSPFHLAHSTRELRHASSLRSTLSVRPSRRNLERERIELEESERRKNKNTTPSLTQEWRKLSLDKMKRQSVEYLGNEMASPLSPSVSDVSALRKWEARAGIEPIPESSFVQSREGKIPGNENDNRKPRDDSVILRRKSSAAASEAERQCRTLSFRTELAQRIMVQSENLSRSAMELRDSAPLEVEVLYETLLEDEVDMLENGEGDVADNGASSTGVVGKVDGNSTSRMVDSSSSTAVSSISTSSNTLAQAAGLSVSTIEGAKFGYSTTQSHKKSETAMKSSPFAFSTSSTSSILDDADIRGRSLSLAYSGTMRHSTMKRVSSNAVIMLSGGDGYHDLDHSRSQQRTDDACVLLWIYKF